MGWKPSDMRLVRLYSNKPDIFPPIEFHPGISAVVAEIKRPENMGKTVHNLGKSTVARLVDFCLLKGRHPSFFLFAHEALFDGFIFFLEIQKDDGRFLTIARSLKSRKPVSILASGVDVNDATEVDSGHWSHPDLGIAPAKRLLDGLLGFSVIAPYDYRDIMGYVLREQDDYGDVFHLRKFRGKHREWKPFLAQLLGLDAQLTTNFYAEVDEVDRLEGEILRQRAEIGMAGEADVIRIEGIITIRRRDVDELSAVLQHFDFARADSDANRELVSEVEEQIATGNEKKYRLSQLLVHLDESLREDAILFSSDQTATLFAEIGVAFKGQLKKNLEQLVAFNRAISEERRGYLLEERAEVTASLERIDPVLTELQAQRAQLFEFLEGSDTIAKYKEISTRVIELRSDITALERQRDTHTRIVRLKQEQRQVQDRKNQLQTAIEVDLQAQVDDSGSRYREIQRYFDEIVHAVLDEHALLTVTPSSSGSLDFLADFVSDSGARTSAARGFTFKKLLCIAFDLAVLRSYGDQSFPRFAFHDGVFESLETRAKHRLLEVLRKYAAMGLQPVITTLDSDLPEPIDSDLTALSSNEIVRRLSDEGDSGRLFQMESF
ncbi:DUF2326 domain-containing protein [Cryobacterium sp. Y57]|uniref:DUF2326 domain-containing protein n=1 Tax=Cryobacterium sp. Y57 TaxID=2048287 RepID=UPI001304ABBB|nr:DUF2326 domain-containing protein [Cryobacterium sp. Y57]